MLDFNTTVKNAALPNLKRETQNENYCPSPTYVVHNMIPYLETNFTSLEL